MQASNFHENSHLCKLLFLWGLEVKLILLFYKELGTKCIFLSNSKDYDHILGISNPLISLGLVTLEIGLGSPLFSIGSRYHNPDRLWVLRDHRILYKNLLLEMSQNWSGVPHTTFHCGEFDHLLQ